MRDLDIDGPKSNAQEATFPALQFGPSFSGPANSTPPHFSEDTLINTYKHGHQTKCVIQ